MVAPGYFEIYPSARPAVPAGSYTITTSLGLTAAPPHGADGDIPVNDTQFNAHIDSPRYTMPPDQVLSTFPPAGSQGDWRERMPQIVLKRRTLPWERNPGTGPYASAPPWLALVVLAEGEGRLSADVDVSQCVTSGVNLGPDADVPTGKYVEVGQSVVNKVFPCLDELALLCHVRKVDLSDTELAMGDDDGYLSVVLSSRLPQPAPPAEAGGELRPLKYTAYLVNLEGQLDVLLPTEPNDVFSFDIDTVTDLVDNKLLAVAPNATLDQVAMHLGGAPVVNPAHVFGAGGGGGGAGGGALQQASKEAAPFGTSIGIEKASASWATGPVAGGVSMSNDIGVAKSWKEGAVDLGVYGPVFLEPSYRFPVLLSWDFTCTGEGGFERLMNKLEVGLLGTLADDQLPPIPEVAPTGHVALSHRTRRGEPARSWYRGPLTPQTTVRLPAHLVHVGDQLRKVTPDGREDISLAALFEIGRLLTFSKPGIVAAMMAWRRELFGAARARSLADLLMQPAFASFGVEVAKGRDALEDLVRNTLVAQMAAVPDKLGPRAQDVGAVRVPDVVANLGNDAVLTGLGVVAKDVRQATATFGVQGLATFGAPVATGPVMPLSADGAAMGAARGALAGRVQQLAADALQMNLQGRRVEDTLDELLARAAEKGRSDV